MSLNYADQEALAISSLALEEYHELCAALCSRTRWSIPISTHAIATVGAIIGCSSTTQACNSMKLASLPDIHWCAQSDGNWDAKGAVGEITNDGWIRYSLSRLTIV
jgi:hypothetical protein